MRAAAAKSLSAAAWETRRARKPERAAEADADMTLVLPVACPCILAF
jgi:hypothetical protein